MILVDVSNSRYSDVIQPRVKIVLVHGLAKKTYEDHRIVLWR